MQLTEYEQGLLDGKKGRGVKRAMEILVRYGEACGAERFVEITSAHVMPKEPPELLEQFTQDVERLPVVTTLHPKMSAFSPDKWREMGIPAEYAAREAADLEKRTAIHERLGFLKTYSCLPMHMGNLPRRGERVSWIGSCAQILVNSLVGARTNKDGTIINLCAALTGRVPDVGLLRSENRFAQVLIRLADGVRLEEDDDFGALGYYVGSRVANKNVAFEGIPAGVTFDQLKYMIAPAAASGSIHICHVVGITPEAGTREEAFGGREPEAVITVSPADIAAAKAQFPFDSARAADLVILGCPHVTIQECGRIADLLRGRKLRSGARLWLAMGKQTYTLAREMGYAGVIEAAGGVFSDTCLATIPDSPIPPEVKTVATNSFKSAHYVKQLQRNRLRVMVGGLAACLDAVAGTVGEGRT